MMNDLYHGDCREIRSVIADNTIDTIITDPPYELGFMGNGWDKSGIALDVKMWREMLLVAKPGALLLTFGGTRTFHRMTCAIEDAGWQIRDCLMWLYGSGFPKSHNLHGKFEGWGTALKPAWEPIIVAMKPLDGTFAENAERWGVAGLNVDGGKIGTEPWVRKGGEKSTPYGSETTWNVSKTPDIDRQGIGRWPANLILDEEAAEMLDGQTGKLPGPWGRDSKGGAKGEGSMFRLGGVNSQNEIPGKESGGASRFFYVAKASCSERNKGCEGLPTEMKYAFQTGDGHSGKPSSIELTKSPNRQPTANNHPTVKPLKLMEYLCTLTKTPTGGIVLDPFAGSGTTLLAAKNVGRQYIGVEQNEKYIKIIEARLGIK